FLKSKQPFRKSKQTFRKFKQPFRKSKQPFRRRPRIGPGDRIVVGRRWKIGLSWRLLRFQLYLTMENPTHSTQPDLVHGPGPSLSFESEDRVGLGSGLTNSQFKEKARPMV
ncbi:hypothetical protein ZWY2020_003059, partial [Hordeum vulgare]